MMCIIHTMQSRELIKLLQADGWQLQRTRGSHHQYVHPTKPGTVTVPHPKTDLGNLCGIPLQLRRAIPNTPTVS